MTTRTLRTVLVAVALTLILPLAACVGLLFPTPRLAVSKTPSAESVTPELEPFYRQVLKWKACEGEGFQCATVTVPMDWKHPAAKSISLSIIRKPASGTAIGSLLVNPGGPGGSGYNFIRDSLDYAVSTELQRSYDVVGFDPRGVNRSSPVKCSAKPVELDHFLFDVSPNPYGSAEWIADQRANAVAFGASCLKHTGEVLGFIDTDSSARDLDLLRATLGDRKLNYLGYSYGTLLGATYAELYPKKTGRLVLDGAVNPAASAFEVGSAQAVGFESALRKYIQDCQTGTKCPFSGSVSAAMTGVRSILDGLDASPLRAKDGRQLSSATMFSAIVYPLYEPSRWPILSSLFRATLKGDPSVAFILADEYYGRTEKGGYNDNSTEAFVGVNCLDYPSPPSTEASLREEEAKFVAVAPTLGQQMAYDTSCETWPFKATRVRGPINARGSAPILVVGTTNDPATPYVWAQELAKQLENGHLISYRGEGHTAYNKSNSCVNNAVDIFFLRGSVPKSDPKC